MKTIRILFVLLYILLQVKHFAFSQDKNRIGFLMDDFNSSRWREDSTIFAKKIRESGNEILIRICDSDTALQHKQAIELMDKGVKVLVVVPANSLAASAIVFSANKRKVPVIAYDRLILNSPLDYFISFDGEKVGELQAEYILKRINYSGSILIMNGPEYDINSLLFKKGQMNVLKPYIDKGAVKIVYDKFLSEWTSLEASMEATDFLSNYDKKIDGIIAANDELAQGIIDALILFRPSEKIPITGQDGTAAAYKNIMEGAQAMTVCKPIDSIAARAAQLACGLAEGKAPEHIETTSFNGLKNIPFIKLEPIAISEENSYLIKPKSSYLTEEFLKNNR